VFEFGHFELVARHGSGDLILVETLHEGIQRSLLEADHTVVEFLAANAHRLSNSLRVDRR